MKEQEEKAREIELQLHLKNMLRLFLDSIRDYEHESSNKICMDERESLEFVEIFIDSEDSFDYRKILSLFERTQSPNKEMVESLWKQSIDYWEEVYDPETWPQAKCEVHTLIRDIRRKYNELLQSHEDTKGDG